MMLRRHLYLLLAILVAALLALAIGLAANWLGALMPCQGEQLACNIDEAIGGYATMIWAGLGPLIFAVTLLIAQNRTALAGATLVLLSPLIVAYGLAMFESWRYVGFYPHKDLRTFLVALAPPVITVLVQFLILGFLMRPGRLSAPKKAAATGAGTGG